MGPERLLTRSFALVFAANTLQGLAFNLFLHFPGYLNELGADELQIGFITALTAVAAIALRPPIGRSMDRHGRRPLILAGGTLNVLVVGLYLTVSGIGPWLYLVRVLHGLAEALLFSSLFTYAADCVPAARRTQGLALFGVSGMLPISLGGLLGDWLLAVADYGAIFLCAEALSVASLLVSLPLRDQPRPAPREGEAPPALGIRAAARQRDLVSLWFIGTVFSLALSAVFVFIKRFVDETGIGTVGGFFTAYTAAALFLRVFLGWLPDQVGPKRVLLPALIALAAGFAALARADGAFEIGVAGALCGFGHGFTFPILFGMVVTRTPDANRGAAMALFTALFDLGVLVGGPAFGGLIEWQGFSFTFATGGWVLLVGTVIFFAWDARVGPGLLLALVAGALACAPRGVVERGLEPHGAALAGHWGHRLGDAHPYVLPREGELVLFLCRWPAGAEVGVRLEGAARFEEVRAFEAALAAWRATPLDVTLVRRRGGEPADVVVRISDERPVTAERFGRGRTLADCALPGGDPSRAHLVSAELDVARALAATPDAARVRLSEEDLTGTLVHELGHALGFQGHPPRGAVMARDRGAVREAGRRALAGTSVPDPTLAALYALPSGTVLARLPTHVARTRDVDAAARRAAGEGLDGPRLRVGDRAARVFWRTPTGDEVGFVLVNLSEALVHPERAVIVAEEAARAWLGEASPTGP